MSIPGLNQRFLWGVHLVVYFVYLGFVSSDLLPFSPEVAKILSVAWLGVFALHAMAVFGMFGSDEPSKAKVTTEEKPKRRLELSDDGELVEVDDDEDDDKRKRLINE